MTILCVIFLGPIMSYIYMYNNEYSEYPWTFSDYNYGYPVSSKVAGKSWEKHEKCVAFFPQGSGSHQQISQPRTVGAGNKQTWGCHDGNDQQTLGFHGI